MLEWYTSKAGGVLQYYLRNTLLTKKISDVIGSIFRDSHCLPGLTLAREIIATSTVLTAKYAPSYESTYFAVHGALTAVLAQQFPGGFSHFFGVQVWLSHSDVTPHGDFFDINDIFSACLDIKADG